MSRYTGRNAQRLIQAKAGFVSVAALLCLSAPVKLTAQPAATEGQQPSAQQSSPAPQPAQTPQAPSGQSPVSSGQPAQQPPAAQTPPAQQTTTPATPQTPPAATPPETATQTPPDATTPGTTPLPTVSVTGTRPQAPASPAPAAPAQQTVQAPPAPPAQPVQAAATAAPNPFFSPSYQTSTLGVGRIGHESPRHAADRQRRAAAGHPRAERRDRQGRAAQRCGRHLPRRRRRQPGRHALHPRLLGAERHLPRRRARSGLVHARHVRGRRGRSLQGTGLGAVRPRLDRRRDQSDQQDCRSSATPSKAPSPATPGPGARATLDANGKVNENIWGRVVAMGQMLRHPGPRQCRAEPLRLLAVADVQAQRPDQDHRSPTSISTTTTCPTTAFRSGRRRSAFRAPSRRSRATTGTAF